MLRNLNRSISVIASSTALYLGFSTTNIDPVQAITIPLENAGFEIPVQTTELIPGTGFFDLETPPGWSLYDPNSLIPDDPILGATSFTGGWRPSELFFPTIPQGEQIGTIFLVPAGAGEVGFTQNAGITVQPRTRYTLSATILDTPGVPGFEVFEGFPGYRIELLAGNTVISADNNTIAIQEGEFQRVEIDYISSKNDPYLGQDLSLRLINLNLDNPNGNGVEVNFDDVQLEATPVPETIPITGYILLAIILILFKKAPAQ